ncbi:helix-turn-helix transcriptional regulator [Streptomyces sp. NPDC003860]
MTERVSAGVVVAVISHAGRTLLVHRRHTDDVFNVVGGAPAETPPLCGERELAALRHAAAGMTLWESARVLGVAYWDARDALFRAARALCPGPSVRCPVSSQQWLSLPVARAVDRGLITSEHVPPPAAASLLALQGQDQRLAQDLAEGLTNLQIAHRLGLSSENVAEAVRALTARVEARCRPHLVAVLLLYVHFCRRQGCQGLPCPGGVPHPDVRPVPVPGAC